MIKSTKTNHSSVKLPHDIFLGLGKLVTELHFRRGLPIRDTSYDEHAPTHPVLVEADKLYGWFANRILICGVCGEMFMKKQPSKQFCSDKCYQKDYRLHKRKPGILR